ncbi:MAG: sulfurtransferase complex subunit TusB [Gammaproteobacteria bacterium]|nr:sulfurtransferase complex subunit TusB [Gammaproteobacteria bacterium]MYJ76230.1 sulfurtransferase complex subunit TusB [Gammaproteobacteria bacterium]
MSVLHLLAGPEAVDACLAAAAEGDAVLLIGDGVFAYHRAEAPKVRFGILAEDAEARGVEPGSMVELLDYDGFVEWVAAFPKSVTWR